MQQIIFAQHQHAAIIAEFQLRMALETQNLKLDAQLVRKGVQYFLELDEKSHLGFYLVKLVDKEVVGSLLITFETEKRWWIQSVYVRQQHRRQGHFSSLFQKGVLLAKENGVETIKLYAQNQNERAKTTYFKLGMHLEKGKIYSYDFVLGSPNLSASSQFHISSGEERKIQLDEWMEKKENILDVEVKDKKAKMVVIEKDKTIVGVFKYFEQFSDWRFGIMRYIQQLYLYQGLTLQETIPEIVGYLSTNSSIKVAVVRIIASEEKASKLKGGHLEHYDILCINLQ